MMMTQNELLEILKTADGEAFRFANDEATNQFTFTLPSPPTEIVQLVTKNRRANRYSTTMNQIAVIPPDPIQDRLAFTSIKGNNSDLIENVARLYLRKSDTIADVTNGKGVFWKDIDLEIYDFHPSDLITCPEHPYDFRNLPYEDFSFDVVVLDPPYVHTPGRMLFEKNYQNRETTKGMDHRAIIQLYSDGMTEAFRILKCGGLLWVKCQDEIGSGKQKWSHVEIHDCAKTLGLYPKDLFILTPNHKPVVQQKEQKHARKNHSYLWIFQKAKNIKGKS